MGNRSIIRAEGGCRGADTRSIVAFPYDQRCPEVLGCGDRLSTER